ncbi:autotransporter domain-containing protein, partial [Bradyrhizobium sp. AUGA SZCCT0274]
MHSSEFVRASNSAQFSECTTRSAPRRRTALLAGTAFTGAFIAAIVGYPQRALAACLGENTGSVTCDAGNQATAGALSTDFAGTTVVNNNVGGKIDTGGAGVSLSAPGTLTFNHNDTTFGITNTAGAGVALVGNGAITYSGNAAVTVTGDDAVSLNSNGGAAGNITVTSNATVQSTTNSGISVFKPAGSGAVLVNGSGTAIGAALGISVVHAGTAGGITISGTGAAVGGIGIHADINAATNASNILIDRSGNVTGGALGINAIHFGTGNITVTGGSLVSSTAGNAIAAQQVNNLAGTNGSVTVGGSGDVNALGGVGIFAEITQTNNTGSVTVTRSGTVTATGTGIEAAAFGGGNVNVSGTGNVSSSGNGGISAVASGGNGNVVIAPTGTVSGLTYGILGTASGIGNVTVTVSQDVTGPQGGGIFASVADGRITVNVAAGTVSGSAAGFLVPGIQAIAAGTGGATINISAGASVLGDQFIGIEVTGTNNIITNNGTIRGASGITASDSTTLVNAGAIIGTLGTAVTFGGSGNTLTLAPGSVITGNVLGTGNDTFQLGGTGAATFDVSQIGPAAQYQGFGIFNKIDASNWTLTGTSSFAGPVTVNGGTLSVNGDITSASGVTVNAGGTLGGAGVVGNTNINGGTLAPGNSIGTLTVSGSLTMTAASTYLVQISGPSSDKTVVTGTANLAGKVTVDPLARVAATTTYTILNAGTVNGSFSTVDFLTANSFARNVRLSYVGNDVLLTVDPGLLSPNLPANANINQKNVAAGIDNALIAGTNMPAGFNALFALTGTGLANALSQVSGETATGSQQATFNAMNQFMGVMMDPFIAGRGDAATAGGNAFGFADEEALAYAAKKRNPNDALAAIYTKAPPMVPFQQRWSVWAAGFGGSQTTDGNTVAGSNTATSRIYGTAIGADYRFSPFTIAGFSLAGGGTNFSVANNGNGRSDLFQAGAFIRHNVGAAYLSGALAYGWQDVTTDRTVTIAGIDQLRARFNANAWSGRVEGGYRFVAPVIGGIGFTPYAAGQFTTFELPAYAEGVISGTNTFALAYGAKSVTDTRSELGLRTDKSFAMQAAILTLRGRVAWAHDFNPDRGIGATFQTLPGA